MAKSIKAPRSGDRARKRALERLGGMMGGERRDPRDRLLHERVRLGVVSALAVSGSMSFPELKGALNVTDGNLSAHARKLEEAEFVECTKTFSGRTPRTTYRLTSAGREALERYLSHMESLIDATRSAREDEA